MGQVDIESLFRVYEQVKEITKQHNLQFSFKIDHGTYETAIEFVGNKSFHPPISENWDSHPDIFCPDLLDWHNKIIIEYEEEVGNPRSGAFLAKKGHHREGDMDNKRDTRRGIFYEQAGFHILRLWESDQLWKEKLEKFLLDFKDNNYCM